MRSCELHAIAIQDRVLLGGAYVDPHYQARREGAFIVAVNCGEAGGTCFCVSMDTGPKARAGFDLALTEISERARTFLVEAGSERGARDPCRAPAPRRPGRARRRRRGGRRADRRQHGPRDADRTTSTSCSSRNLEHPRWDDVAERCLTCGNCTMVCPTCFCTSVEDASDLAGASAERSRRWDSCFTMDFSYIHGGSVRASPKSRYRQWMTHKLATWFDQFGTSGCVGCGRCITWCPVGIDITEEVRAIRARTGAERGDMIEGMDRIVREHPFFAGLEEDAIQLVAGCARNVRFDAGQYLFREGEPADEFYLIRHGRVALEVTAPGRGADHHPDRAARARSSASPG